MGGIGRAIGYALAGAGEGLEKQAMFDMEAERQRALEALRHSNSMTERQTGADLADRNNARSQARGFVYDTKKTEQSEGFRTADREDRQEFELKLKSIGFANDKALAQFRSSLSVAEARTKAGIERDITSGDITRVVQDDSGAYYGVHRDGSTKPLGITGALSYSDRRPVEDTSIGSLDGEATSRGIGGARAKPSGQESPGWTDQDENRLRTRYANATPQTAPGLFRDGKKIPLDEVRRLMQGGR